MAESWLKRKCIVRLQQGKAIIRIERKGDEVTVLDEAKPPWAPLNVTYGPNAAETDALFLHYVKVYQKQGYREMPREDEIRQSPGKKTKRPGLVKTLAGGSERFKAEADEVLQMWREDEYDNTKDALQDVRSLLRRVPRNLIKYQERLERIEKQAMRELVQLAKKDPGMATYVQNLLSKAKTKPINKRKASRALRRKK